MTIIHANDPTTQFLSQLYSERGDVSMHITEGSTHSAVVRAIRSDSCIMMLGHGNPYGLFSKPNKKGRYERLLVADRDANFLRDKTCIGIWCKANQFAEHYKLHGLFSGMIISELKEAIDLEIPTTQEELNLENDKFARRLAHCLATCELKDIPDQMKALDDVRSPLTTYNYNNLYYYE